MTRRHADPVEVVRRDETPAQFLWRGRLHLVRAVHGRWVEGVPWWRGPAVAALREGALAGGGVPRSGGLGLADDREVWRVEAAAGRTGPLGVFDLAFDPGDGRWLLVRVHD